MGECFEHELSTRNKKVGLDEAELHDPDYKILGDTLGDKTESSLFTQMQVNTDNFITEC